MWQTLQQSSSVNSFKKIFQVSHCETRLELCSIVRNLNKKLIDKIKSNYSTPYKANTYFKL